MLTNVTERWDHVIHKVTVFSANETWLTPNKEIVFGPDIQYPFCHTLDPFQYFDVNTTSKLNIWIKKMHKLGIEIFLEDKNLKTARALKSTRFSYSGTEIKNQDLYDTKNIYFMIEFSQTLNTPLNLKKPCQNYPSEEFESYEECDFKFVRESVKNQRNFTPFWATQSLLDVTKLAFSKSSNTYDYMKYVLGDENSQCLNPCLATKVRKYLLQYVILNFNFHSR